MRRWLKPDRLIPLGVALVPLVLVALWLAFLAPAWLYHPLAAQVCRATYHTAAQVRDCLSYNFHSGIEANLGELALVVTAITGLVGWWAHHNCHHEGCIKRGHPHPQHGWPACRDHWDETPSHIARAS